MVFENLQQIITHCKWEGQYEYMDDYFISVNEQQIIDIFNGNINESETTVELLLWIAIYFRHIKNDYLNMKKFLKMTIKKKNTLGMTMMASYYFEIEQYTKMKKYYKMAINKGYSPAMNNMAYYYLNIKKNISKAVSMYKRAIEKGNMQAMTNLGVYYYTCTYDKTLGVDLFKQAVKKGDSNAMNNLAIYYCSIGAYFHAIQLFERVIEKGNLHSNAINNLAIIKKLYYKK